MTKRERNAEIAELARIPSVKKLLYAKRIVVDSPDNVKLLEAVKEIEDKCTALAELCKMVKIYNLPDVHENIVSVLIQMGEKIASRTRDMRNIKVNLIEQTF